jgi:hypothetical protein
MSHEAYCKALAKQAVRLWLLQNICPECGHEFSDGHGEGCPLSDVGGAEVPIEVLRR